MPVLGVRENAMVSEPADSGMKSIPNGSKRGGEAPGPGPERAARSDEELISRARAGDDTAFRRLVERYEGQVAATVVSMLGAGDEADDVGQETFIRFYRAMDNFRGESRLGTYLTRIAINLSLRAIKRRRTWVRRFVSRDAAAPPVSGPVVDGVGEVESRSRAELVQRAIAGLSPVHRAVVVLRMIDGYSTRETAEMLGVPPGTVMSRLSRALEKLQVALEPLVGPEG